VIEENGQEVKILRDNMPFGSIAKGEFGTYFIGYSRSPRTIEQMLENMFVGRPPGNYDRILDFSTAVTGGLFFVTTATFLDDVADAPATDGAIAAPAPTTLQVNMPASCGSVAATASTLNATASSPAVTARALDAPAASLAAAGCLNIGSLKGQPNE
jgi:putative iron-dependent peroxidase